MMMPQCLQTGVIALGFVILPGKANAAAVFTMNTASYPSVGDHHCLAMVCGGLNFIVTGSDEPLKGFHYDPSSTYRSSRSKALGCGGVMDCSDISRSCDEIPYQSTFDGGLGCFASDWVADGRSVDDLYAVGTHACVNRVDNSRHGTALQVFYRDRMISKFQEFVVALLVDDDGCTPSPVCNDILFAVKEGLPPTVVCGLAPIIQELQFTTVTTPVNKPTPSPCPSRPNLAARDIIGEEGIGYSKMNVSAHKRAPATPRIGVLQDGTKVLELIGEMSVGDEVWIHDEFVVDDEAEVKSRVGILATVGLAVSLLPLPLKTKC